MEHWWNEIDRGKPKYCPSATLSTTYPTRTDPGSNPGLRGGRTAANRLSYGTALQERLKDIVSSTTVYNLRSGGPQSEIRETANNKGARSTLRSTVLALIYNDSVAVRKTSVRPLRLEGEF
jgi:hypothetical protein